MGIREDLTRNVSNSIDDIVSRYNELRRLEMHDRLSQAGRAELQAIRHQLHLDD